MRNEIIDAKDGGNTLLIVPHIDVGRGRSSVVVPFGLTVAEMVDLALVGLPVAGRDKARVTIGDHVIRPEVWRLVRPRDGNAVIVRFIPQNDQLRSILSIAVIVSAVALGQFYAPGIAGSLSGIAFPGGFAATSGLVSLTGSLVTAGLAIAGSLLLNALIPVRGLSDQDKGSDTYAITGLQNSANPGGAIPSILGRHRYAPPYASTPRTTVIGDDQYVITSFLLGHGPLTLSNHRLGDTPIGEYANVDMEIRYGYPGDDHLNLVPQTVLEEQLSINLTNDGPPIVRLTARDVTEAEVDLAFVQGLVHLNDKRKAEPYTVTVLLAHRKYGDAAWTPVATLAITGNQQNKIIRRSHRWTFPVRGQYEVSVFNQSGKSTNPQTIDRCDWSALRSFRPESPLNFKSPVAMVALRIRSSNQLNGTVSNYNCDAALLCRDWDADTQTWIVRETSNPASLFRHVLQGPANAYPKTDAQINLERLQEWHEFCDLRGLRYNRVHDYNASRLDVLADIAAAGRATPHDDGVQWGVTIDRPTTTYVSAISPRNSWDFQGTTPQVLFPDGHRVQFIDETNGYQQAERVVPFPGIDINDVAVTEDMSHPGVTDPDLIWLETRRRQYELIYRPHTYVANQDIESLVVARGDLVALNHDVIDRDQVSCRVRSVEGNVVGLDTSVTMEAGRSYACSIRLGNGTVVRRSVAALDGETGSLNLIGDLSGVEPGNLALFGTSLRGSVIDCIVKNIERGDNLTAKITFVDAAPIIDELVDGETPPPWDGRVGGEVDVSGLVPAVPSLLVTDSSLVFHVSVSAGTGSIAVPASFIVSYRPHGGGAFSTVSVPASESIIHIPGFIVGDIIDVKARAISSYGVASADSSITQATLHAAVANDPTLDSDTTLMDTTVVSMDHF